MAKKSTFIVLAASSMIFLTACGDPLGDKYVSFAKCLTQKNVVMYGAYWCPHCANQKALFGPQGVKELNYIECDPRGKYANQALCVQKGIRSYPTWIFTDGSISKGELSLTELSSKSTCPLPPGEPSTPLTSTPAASK